MEEDRDFMEQALAMAERNLTLHDGGPFGAVVVKDGKVIGRGFNRVIALRDPSAHAEVNAIRDACLTIQSHELTGCTIYTTSEPCPMCLGAIYWARIDRVVFGSDRQDVKGIEFDDSHIYEEVCRPFEARKLKFDRMLQKEARELLLRWFSDPKRVSY